MPNAIEMLKGQHRDIDALFAELEGPRFTTASKEELVKRLKEKLAIHTRIEEEIFYPAAKSADNETVLEAYLEHDNVEHALGRLMATQVSDSHFGAAVAVLKDLVERHVEREETVLFPKTEEELGDSMLEELAGQMTEMMAAPKRRAVRKAPARAAARKRRAPAKKKEKKTKKVPTRKK